MERRNAALTGVAQWIVRLPANQGVPGLILGWGTCLGCKGQILVGGHARSS